MRPASQIHLRPAYERWRDTSFLPIVARLVHDAPAATRAELADLQRAIGSLLGEDARGGARTRERWVRCSRKKAATCSTCQATPGHGPYLEMKIEGKWKLVEETDEQRERRRDRALREHRGLADQHALALLEEAHAGASGFLQGEAARAAEADIRARLLP